MEVSCTMFTMLNPVFLEPQGLIYRKAKNIPTAMTSRNCDGDSYTTVLKIEQGHAVVATHIDLEKLKI